MTIPIYFATMSGNSRDLAERTARKLKALGFDAEERDLIHESADALRNHATVLFVISTWGDGEPPDDAVSYVERLQSDEPLGLEGVQFSVCALGDTGYEHFCGCGRTIDVRLEHHGARRLAERVDCDIDFEENYDGWLNSVVAALDSRRAVVAESPRN
jgi:sulfite reductase (NADPH) flavoprotein alpha-component